MQEKLFMFGTGKIARKYTQLLNQMSVCIEGYIDNDKNKWGTYFYNKEVYKPDILRQIEMPEIVIACADTSEISQQLTEMNLHDRIISIEHLMKRSIKKKSESIRLTDHSTDVSEKKIMIDNLYGQWGGAEDWCHIVASSLADREHDVVLVENTKQPPVGYIAEENIVRVDTDKDDEYQVYLKLTKMLLQKKPVILFNVWNSILLWAAITVKYAYPEEIRIISCILNDAAYEKFCMWDESIDLYLCISSRIQNKLIDSYGIDKNKVYCRTPFIEKIRAVNKKYHMENDEPLRIGYPCRLVQSQKRADLIPRLIMYMNEMGINYLLNIAGDGPCEGTIKKYVEECGLCAKVKLHGRLSRTELLDFLDQQDVYLNISEYEGTSLTMLEAMAGGCVPVVTDVSGVNDFIESGTNGFIADVGDLRGMAEYIALLDKNRNLLAEYGSKCIDIVQEKCRINKYIDSVENIIESL